VGHREYHDRHQHQQLIVSQGAWELVPGASCGATQSQGVNSYAESYARGLDAVGAVQREDGASVVVLMRGREVPKAQQRFHSFSR
jgi:hypothetical protein